MSFCASKCLMFYWGIWHWAYSITIGVTSICITVRVVRNFAGEAEWPRLCKMQFPVCLRGEQNCKTVAHFKQGQNWLRTILLSSFTQVEAKSLNKWRLRCSFLNKYLKSNFMTSTVSQNCPVSITPSLCWSQTQTPQSHLPRPLQTGAPSTVPFWRQVLSGSLLSAWSLKTRLKSIDFRQLYFLGYVCISE